MSKKIRRFLGIQQKIDELVRLIEIFMVTDKFKEISLKHGFKRHTVVSDWHFSRDKSKVYFEFNQEEFEKWEVSDEDDYHGFSGLSQFEVKIEEIEETILKEFKKISGEYIVKEDDIL